MIRRGYNETDISTEQNQTEAFSRFSGPVQDQERPGYPAASPGQGAQKAVRLGFPRQFRLTDRPQYRRCYSRGRRFFTPSFILFVLPTSEAQWRLGIAASKKVGKAVDRNRIKRLVREVFRVNQQRIDLQADIVVVVKKSAPISTLNFHRVQGELLYVLDKAGRKLGCGGYKE